MLASHLHVLDKQQLLSLKIEVNHFKRFSLGAFINGVQFFWFIFLGTLW